MLECSSRLLAGIALLAGMAMVSPSHAQQWPAKPIRLVVPFPAGGGTDVTARTVANRLSEVLGQAIVIDNKGGAGGTIGSDAVAKAEPDGYTIGIATSSTHPAAVILQKNVPYDPVKSFAPITLIGTTPYILVASQDFAPKTLSEFIAYAKANPEKVDCANVGVSTLGYLVTQNFQSLTGVKMTHITYRGAGQAYPDVIAGRVPVFFDNPTGSASFVKDGRLKAYAVSAKSAVLPDVPTFAEAGLPGFETTFWYGFVAPAGTPRDIIDRIQQGVAKVVLSPEGKAELLSKDITPVASTPEEFGRTIQANMTEWQALADKVGIKPE